MSHEALAVRHALLTRCVAIFACGVARESLNVAWVHYTQSGRVGLAMLVATINGAIALVGISESLKSRWVAACYVAGDSAGTGIGASIKHLL